MSDGDEQPDSVYTILQLCHISNITCRVRQFSFSKGSKIISLKISDKYLNDSGEGTSKTGLLSLICQHSGSLSPDYFSPSFNFVKVSWKHLKLCRIASELLLTYPLSFHSASHFAGRPVIVVLMRVEYSRGFSFLGNFFATFMQLSCLF